MVRAKLRHVAKSEGKNTPKSAVLVILTDAYLSLLRSLKQKRIKKLMNFVLPVLLMSVTEI